MKPIKQNERDERQTEGTESDRYVAARRKAANILAYSDNTRARLIEKLRRAGYEAEICSAVADELTAKGMLDEERMARHAVEYLAEVKLFGRRRIYAELNRRGFSREVVENCAGEVMEGYDFAEICLKLAKKQRISPGEAGRLKLQRTLTRYGFSSDEIRSALRAMKPYFEAESEE